MRERVLTQRVGELIRHLRQEKGYSQEVLAELANSHRNYIGAVERAEKTMSIETANVIAGAFGLEIWEFFALLDKEDKAKSNTLPDSEE